MTAVAASSFHYHGPRLTHRSPIDVSISTPATARSASEGQNGKARSSRAVVGQKRTLTPRASFGGVVEGPPVREETPRSRTGTPNSTSGSTSWLRRLSSNMSHSRESSQAPSSRPGSAAVSRSNGSFMAVSHSGSTTPIFPDTTVSPLPPNKLVKRSSSVRSTNGIPLPSAGSRLPLAVLRRPATSHQRSANLRQTSFGPPESDRMSIDGATPEARDSQLRHYFTPKSAPASWPANRRRSSSAIPTPIHRVYPDRRYTPILMSASSAIKRASVEMDEGTEASDGEEVPNVPFAPALAASSPFPALPVRNEEAPTPRRSFSIGDLLSTGPQPLWRRPSQKKSKTPGSKLVRRRDRIVSAPQTAMGNTFSSDHERPAKRRDLTNPQLTPRSIYSSSSSNPRLDSDPPREIELNLSSDKAPYTSPRSASPPLERRLPSITSISAAARSSRVSAAHSEGASFLDSDSEHQSIGDISTDYQSDTAFNSYNTRTTRSSSGRRGPHIEKIFEDSPPTFSSSGRSTKLKDILNGASYPTADFSGNQRHSTIEEENSIASTPVRSLRTTSVMSTPSARPGAVQVFHSSPPEMRVMPDPDEMDWDASDDETTDLPEDSAHHRLAFRVGPSLLSSGTTTTATSPNRLNGLSAERPSLYDWSEAQPSPGNSDSPARPRTVHGKKDADSRGSRAAGRRAPSSMHARSHSVPVAPDGNTRRGNVMANRFGTWNVGSKMVTEDWNDDFAFDEALEAEATEDGHRHDDDGGSDDRSPRPQNMIVPRSIREQQQNVVANISLLREWGLLIEELKELRVRASTLDMLDGPHGRDWEEVDAMIELADQETEEQTLEPRRSPPSSPGFDYGAFEEQPSANASAGSARGRPARPSDSTSIPVETSPALSGFEYPPHAGPSSSHQPDGITRPRKDSEAVARYVIEALQSKRSVSDAGPSSRADAAPRKVPFDTSTLRHIVPYVKRLKRRVKEALRETEDLHTSPVRPKSPRSTPRQRDDYDDSDDEDEHDLGGDDDADADADASGDDNDGQSNMPPFQSPFSANNDALVRRRSRRDEARTDHDGAALGGLGIDFDLSNELADRVRDMNLPR